MFKKFQSPCTICHWIEYKKLECENRFALSKTLSEQHALKVSIFKCPYLITQIKGNLYKVGLKLYAEFKN